MEVDNLAATLGSNGVFRERLDSMRTLVENCVNAVRNMSLLLRPSMLDDLGLVAALETPVGGEEDSQLGDFIADKAVVSPSDEVINLKLKEQTASVLRTLTPREEKIIKMRFGLEDSRQHTLEEVGQSFGLTRERIRQNEA